METPKPNVPFFRASIGQAEIDEVVKCLKSGWLTTGVRTKQFESDFATAVGAKHAVAVNSCTAALHLAVEALQLRPTQAVLVPTMTFAATAEIVRYQGAFPILVDCVKDTLNIDLQDAEAKMNSLLRGELPIPRDTKVVGIIPVHVGGLMVDMEQVEEFARRHSLWVIEDSAHALPAAYKTSENVWKKSGENTAAVTCYSFYANKTITTGEGGMAVTENEELAQRIRRMSLHGLSNDAWKRFSGAGEWDYRILAPGYKYNMTDVAASLGIHQLARAEAFRAERENLAMRFRRDLTDLEAIELPQVVENRLHAWHLFPIRLNRSKLSISRNEFMKLMREQGVGNSVHWRPLHLHTYYENEFHWLPSHCPVATEQWERLISLPLFPGMTDDEYNRVVGTVRSVCGAHKA